MIPAADSRKAASLNDYLPDVPQDADTTRRSSVFDRSNRRQLQQDVLSGKVDADTLLPDLVDYIDTEYYNLFANLDTGEHSASPVSRRGNPQYAFRQSIKKKRLNRILKRSTISFETPAGIYSHLFFMTLTIDHKVMSRDRANFFITSKGKGISRFFSRLEKSLEGGYSKVIVKESTVSGYPAVHIILHLDKPLKVRFHRKSNSYRPDPTDPYTRSILGRIKNLSDWNSPSPVWNVGFIDIYAFTADDLGIKGYATPINYISKYITKSLDLDHIEELRKCRRVSELPAKYRTAVWTILNSLIWNSHTWVISKAFKEDMQKLEEEADRKKGSWMWVDTVHRSDPRLYRWMGYDDDNMDPNLFSKGPPAPV